MSSAANTTTPTLLDKLGGPTKMIAVMDDFYGRVLADPQLARFFENIDVVKLKRHSLNIIATAFAPPTSEEKEEALIQDIPAYLTRTHKRLFEKMGHTEEHFDLFVGHFCDTIEDVGGVDEETRREARDKLVKFRVIFEEGARNAALKEKKRRESKVRFSHSKKEHQGSVTQAAEELYIRTKQAVMEADPKWKAAGVCVVVVGVVATVLLRRRRV